MSLFKRGYKYAREEAKRQEEQQKNRGKKLFQFYLPADRGEADLRFLNEEPVNFDSHVVKEGNSFRTYLCTGEDCPLCEDGEKSSARSAYLVIDRGGNSYKDREGKTQKAKPSIRLFIQGVRVVSLLDRISSKYGLTNRDITMVRNGTGQNTVYSFERGEKEPISEKEIRELLPEKLRDKYDGSEESIMDIIEDQLMMLAKNASEEDDEEEEIDEEEYSSRKRLVNLDDEEDDDEEEEEPVKKRLFRKRG